MKRILFSIATLLILSVAASAQSASSSASSSAPIAPTPTTQTASGIPAAPAINANSTPVELARAALAAQGGDKFKNLKNVWLVGTVDLYAPNSAQSIPGKFSLVTAGPKMRLDVDASPVFKFKQIFDGQQSFSSMPGVQMPPADRFGLVVLTKFDQAGYTVTALPDKKKLRGFRITDAEGNSTDFYIDAATGRVMQYLIPYNGYTFGFENSKFKDVEGVLIPMNYTQRLEMPQGAFFAEYHVKDIKLNQQLGDDVFVIQ